MKSIVYFFIPYLFHIISVYYHKKIIKFNKLDKRRPLNDIIINNFIDLSDYNYLIDPLLLIFLLPYLRKNGLTYLIKFFKIFSLIVGIRIISSTVTEIPSSDPNCNNGFYDKSIISYLTGHCFDKIFSGHTSFSFLAFLITNEYNLIGKKLVPFYMIFQIMYSVFLICSKSHYTVDVFLSYVIVYPIYKIFINQV